MREIRGPAFGRALLVQLAVIGAIAVALALVPDSSAVEKEIAKPVEPEKPKEERVVVVKVERIPAKSELAKQQPPPQQQPPPPKQQPPKQQPPPQQQQPPKQQPPQEQLAQQPQQRPREQPAQQPQRSTPAEISDVGGVPLRVLVPSSPSELERYVRRSNSCLLVSRLSGDRADVVESLDLTGGRALSSTRPPCSGVPRVIRDRALIQALGDPITRTRTTHANATGELVMQIVLPPSLVGDAENAAKKRLGNAPPKELARRAAEVGYEIRCFAKTDGSLACI